MNGGRSWAKVWAAVAALLGLGLGGGSLVAAVLGGGSFRLVGQAVGGGGASAGGDYAVVGTTVTGSATASRGGEFVLSGGLAPVQVVPNPAVPMKVVFTSDKLAELSWPEGTTGYVLEFSPVVGPGAEWTPTSPQPVGNTFVTPCAQPARFFRLRKL